MSNHGTISESTWSTHDPTRRPARPRIGITTGIKELLGLKPLLCLSLYCSANDQDHSTSSVLYERPTAFRAINWEMK